MGPTPQKRKRRVSGVNDSSIAAANATLHYLMGSSSRMNRWKNMPTFHVEPRNDESTSNAASSPRSSPPSPKRPASRSATPAVTNARASHDPDTTADNNLPAQIHSSKDCESPAAEQNTLVTGENTQPSSLDPLAVDSWSIHEAKDLEDITDSAGAEDQTSNETAQVPSLPSPAPSEHNESAAAEAVKEVVHKALPEQPVPVPPRPVPVQPPLAAPLLEPPLPPIVLEQQNVAAQCIQPPISPPISRTKQPMTLDTPDSARSTSTWQSRAQSSTSQSPHTANTSVASRPSTSHRDQHHRSDSRNTPFSREVLESQALQAERDLRQQPGRQFEQSRLASILQAIRRDDWFFIVLHQLYCLRSISPTSLPEKIKRLGDGAWNCLEALLAPNRGLKIGFLQWSSDFPRSIMDFYSNDDLRASYNNTVEQIVFFLVTVEREWERVRKECMERRVALLAQEMLDRLGIGSSVLQGIYFRWLCRMLIGSTSSTTDILAALDELHEADRIFCQRGLKRADASLEQAKDAMVAAFADATSCSVQRRLFPATPSSPFTHFHVSPAIRRIINPLLHPAQHAQAQTTQHRQLAPLKAHDRFIVPSHGYHREPPPPAADDMVRNRRSQSFQAHPMLLQQPMSPQLMHQPAHRMITPGAPPMGSPRDLNPAMQVAAAHQQSPQTVRAMPNGYPAHNSQVPRRQATIMSSLHDAQPEVHPSRMPYNRALVAPHQNVNGPPQYGQQMQAMASAPGRQGQVAYRAYSPQSIVPQGFIGAPMPIRLSHAFPRRAEMPRSQPMVPDSNKSALHQAHLRSPTLAPMQKDTPLLYRYVCSLEFGPHQLKAHCPMEKCTIHISPSIYQRLVKTTQADEPGARSMRDVTEDSLSLRLRCIKSYRTSLSDWVTTDGAWPESTYFQLNNKYLEPRLKLHYNRCLPIDITECVRAGDNELLIAINRHDEDKTLFDYSIAVEAVTAVSRQTIIQKLTVLSAEESLEAIKRSLSAGSSNDDDIAITSSSMTIRTRDPISGTKPCDIPVRGIHCKHRDCFDLDVFLSIMPRERPEWPSAADKWQCPICGSDVRPDALLRDDFLIEVRQQLAQSGMLDVTRDIIIQADGQWRAKREDDNTGVRSASLERESGPNKRRSVSAGIKRADIEIVELD